MGKNEKKEETVPAELAASLIGLGVEIAAAAIRVDVGGVAVAVEASVAAEATVDDMVDGRGDGAESGREGEGD